MRVALVTDSTATLPRERAERAGISVVPLQVSVGEREHTDGVDVGPGEIAAAMRGRTPVSTSRPTPLVLREAYERCAGSGAEEIVSVHISGALSGTSEAAESAAADAPVPVRVVDSRTLSMAMGFGVLAGAEAAAAGAGAEEVEARVRAVCDGSSLLLYVDTLEHLRRGGRIGGARALLGSALAIKPILHIEGGAVEPLERVRTAGKAIARLEALCAERAAAIRAGGAGVAVAVHHLDAQERAEGLAERLAGTVDGPVDVLEVGAVLGAHVGPGTIAVALAPTVSPR